MKKLYLVILFSIFLFFFILNPVINHQFYGSDTGRIWYSSENVLQDGPDYILKTFMPLVSTYYYSLIILFFGTSSLIVLNSLIIIALLIVVFLIIRQERWKKSSFFLFCLMALASQIFFVLSNDLRPYFMGMLFILFSYYYFIRYQKTKGFLELLLCTSFILFSVMTQAIFVISGILLISLFLLVLLKIFHKKEKKQNILGIIIPSVLLGLPWFLYRFLIAGFDFYKTPYHWMHYEGFWSEINREIMQRAMPLSTEYFSFFIKQLEKNIVFLSVLILFIFLFILSKKINFQKGFFKLGIILFVFALPFLIGKVPTESRYLFPFLVFLLFIPCRYLDLKRYSRQVRVIFIFCLVILCIFNFAVNYGQEISNQKRIISLNKEIYSVLPSLSPGNIYVRSFSFAQDINQKKIYTTTDLELDDAFIFITWPSDKEVISVLNKYNISNVFLHKNLLYEIDYNQWTLIYGNKSATHYIKIKQSTSFKKTAETTEYTVYSLNLGGDLK